MSALFECRLIRSDGDCGKLKGTCLVQRLFKIYSWCGNAGSCCQMSDVFRCQRCVCLCKVSKLFNVGHQTTLKTPVWTDLNICRWTLPMCSCQCVPYGLKDTVVCTGLPIWDVFLPSPPTKYPYLIDLAQMSTVPKTFLWISLSWMCLSLPFLCTHMLYLFSWHAFVCLSLSSSSLWAFWEQGCLSLTHLCNSDPSNEVTGVHDHGRKKKSLAHKTRRLMVTFAVRRRVLKTAAD